MNVVVGKPHPSLYAFLGEMQKEQADVEIMKRQLQLGQKVRKNPDPKRILKEEEMYAMVSDYDQHFEDDEVLEFLKNVGYNIRL